MKIVPAILAALLSHAAMAQDAALRVLVSNGLRGSMEALQPQLEKDLKRKLSIDYSSTAGLRKRIEAGENFDATLITVEAINALAKQAKVAREPRADLGYSRLGIGIRKGAAKPDLHDANALKQTLLSAKSITYPKDGASREYLETMFEMMGITPQLKPKIQLADGSAASTAAVAGGKADLVITLYSEIVPVPGVEIAGPLPREWDYKIIFAGAPSSNTRNLKAVEAFLRAMGSAKTMEVMHQKGMEPPK